MSATKIDIATEDGVADSHFFLPDGPGPWPAVLLYMDGLGIRPTLLEHAARLASNGYAVLLPNLYYRHGPAQPIDMVNERDRMMAMVQSVTNANIVRDTAAFFDFLDNQPTVAGPRIGCIGYCMGGPLALTAAAAYPDRVAAAASIHGARLVTDAPDSPHLQAGKMRGKIYVGVSEIDPWLAPDETARLSDALAKAGADHEVEIYPGVQHGFSIPGVPIYDRDAAEHHWDKILGLYRSTLAA